MKSKKCTYLLFGMVFICILVSTSCASSKRGKLLRETGPSVTVDQVVDSWEDYNVYWYGSNFTWVRGILFDPKDDERVLTAEGWERVDDEDSFNRLLSEDLNIRHRRGRFYRVLGPEDQFFGYLIVTRDHPSPGTKMIDENTLNVFPIQGSMRDGW